MPLDLIGLSVKSIDIVLQVLSSILNRQAFQSKMYECIPFCNLFLLLKSLPNNKLLPCQYLERFRFHFHSIFRGWERLWGTSGLWLVASIWYPFPCFSSWKCSWTCHFLSGKIQGCWGLLGNPIFLPFCSIQQRAEGTAQ